jgi:hypothetical protein
MHRATQSEPWLYAEVSDQRYAPAALPLVSPVYIICVHVHEVLYGYVFPPMAQEPLGPGPHTTLRSTPLDE